MYFSYHHSSIRRPWQGGAEYAAMATEAVILTRLESPPEMNLISNDNAFLNDFDVENNFDQRTLFARFDCGGDDVSMFVQKPVFNAAALFGLLGCNSLDI